VTSASRPHGVPIRAALRAGGIIPSSGRIDFYRLTAGRERTATGASAGRKRFEPLWVRPFARGYKSPRLLCTSLSRHSPRSLDGRFEPGHDEGGGSARSRLPTGVILGLGPRTKSYRPAEGLTPIALPLDAKGLSHFGSNLLQEGTSGSTPHAGSPPRPSSRSGASIESRERGELRVIRVFPVRTELSHPQLHGRA